MARKKFDKEELIGRTRSLGGWLKLLGIAKIIQGAFLVITIFGAGFGAVTIWEGLLLSRAANGSMKVSAGKLELLGKETLHPLKTYFIIQVAIVVLTLAAALFGLSILAGLIGTGFFTGLIELFKNFQYK
jgi:hypothetical protein